MAPTLCLELLLLLAMVSAAMAVTCGDLGDIPLSGCSACSVVNVTIGGPGRGGPDGPPGGAPPPGNFSGPPGGAPPPGNDGMGPPPDGFAGASSFDGAAAMRGPPGGGMGGPGTGGPGMGAPGSNTTGPGVGGPGMGGGPGGNGTDGGRPPRGPGGPGMGNDTAFPPPPQGSLLLPSCTVCDSPYALPPPPPAGNDTTDKPGRPVECVCEQGKGREVTGNQTVTIGNWTHTYELFNCIDCGAGVPLGPQSGLMVVRTNATSCSIVLQNVTTGTTTRAKSIRRKTVQRAKVFAKATGQAFAAVAVTGARLEAGGGDRGCGYTRGQCVPCPAGSTKVNVTTCA